MGNNIQEFGDIAVQLAKNPLGIIAMAFVLIYGIAALLTKAGSFDPPEKKILAWFLALFPVLVLTVFTYLVIFHHTKLYAPYDFKNENNFFNGQNKNGPSEEDNPPNEHIQPTPKSSAADGDG